jgi:hypothetical protein
MASVLVTALEAAGPSDKDEEFDAMVVPIVYVVIDVEASNE